MSTDLEVARVVNMARDPTEQARSIVERLRKRGQRAAADHLERQLSLHGVETGLLFALREACETILTAIEAIDPVTQTMIDELRLEVEKRLRLSDDRKDKR